MSDTHTRTSLKDNVMRIIQFMLSTRTDGQDWKLSDIKRKFNNVIADPVGVMKTMPRVFHLKMTTKSVDLKCPIEVCTQHWASDGCIGNCRKLHICKFFVLGSCRRNAKCKFGHFLKQDHNLDLLMRANIDSLEMDEIRCLLSKSLSFKRKGLPNICIHHNRPNGCRAGEQGEGCPYMHICERFLKYNTCAYHDDYCRHSHDVAKPQVKEILFDFGYDLDVTSSLEVLRELRDRYSKFSRHPGENGSMSSQYGSEESLESRGSGEPEPTHVFGGTRPKDVRLNCRSKTGPLVKKDQSIKKDDICVFHLEGKCKYKDKCARQHTPMPYQWQFYDMDEKTWLHFAEILNQDLEKIYCDPVYEGVPLYFGQKLVQIYFNTMSYKGEMEGEIRRLSTPSFVQDSRESHYSTQWVWYWMNEFNAWQEYSDSRAIEEHYLGGEDTFEFKAGAQDYALTFKEMHQKNVRYGTERGVRRRPKVFVPKLKDSSTDGQKDGKEQIYPDTWTISKSGAADTSDVKLALLNSGSAEHTEVAQRCLETLNAPITAIYRVENADLWDEYIRKKQKMIKKKKVPTATLR